MNALLNVTHHKKQILNPFSTYFCVFLCTCFVSLYGLYTSACTAHANGKVTAFIYPELNRSEHGNYPTGLYFLSDSTLCIEEYGEDYEEYCDASFGETGMTAKGIITYNMPEGEWVWDSSVSLKFIPKHPWQDPATWQNSVDVKQKFEIDLVSFEIPDHIQLSNDIFSGKYITIGARVEDGNFFFDSSKNASHALSYAITFSESLDEVTRKDIEERTTLHKAKGDNVRIGKQNWTWFNDYTKAVVYAPILHLPKNHALVLITLYDIGLLSDDGNIYGDTIWNEVFIVGPK